MPIPPVNDEFLEGSNQPEPSISQKFVEKLVESGGFNILSSMQTLSDFHHSISDGVIVPESEFQKALNDPHMVSTLNMMRDTALEMYGQYEGALPSEGFINSIKPILGSLAESAVTASPKDIMNTILIDAHVEGIASRVKNGSATPDDIGRHRVSQDIGAMAVILENPQEEIIQALCSGEIQIEDGDIRSEYQFLNKTVMQGEMVLNNQIKNLGMDVGKHIPEGMCP